MRISKEVKDFYLRHGMPYHNRFEHPTPRSSRKKHIPKKSFNPFRKHGMPNPFYRPDVWREMDTKMRKNHTEPVEVLRAGILSNHVNIKLGKLTKRKLTPGKLVNMYSIGGLISHVSGLQTATPIYYLNTVSQALTSTGTGYTSTQSPSSYFDMNPYQAGTSNFIGAKTGLTIPPKPADDTIYLDNIQSTITFTNGINFQIELSLYILKAKCNHSITPLNAWDNGYVDQAYGQSIYTLPTTASGTKAGSVSSGYMNSSVLFTNPKDSKQFKDLWQILDVNTFKLDAQSTCRQNIHMRFHKFYKREKLTNLGTTFMTGTLCFMVVQRGLTVIKDNSTLIGAAFQSQLDGGSCRWFCQNKVTARCVPETAGRLSVNQYTGAYTVTAATAANQGSYGAADTYVPEVDLG